VTKHSISIGICLNANEPYVNMHLHRPKKRTRCAPRSMAAREKISELQMAVLVAETELGVISIVRKVYGRLSGIGTERKQAYRLDTLQLGRSLELS